MANCIVSCITENRVLSDDELQCNVVLTVWPYTAYTK